MESKCRDGDISDKTEKVLRMSEEYQGNLILVGLNYDKKTKEHNCIIEKFVK